MEFKSSPPSDLPCDIESPEEEIDSSKEQKFIGFEKGSGEFDPITEKSVYTKSLAPGIYKPKVQFNMTGIRLYFENMDLNHDEILDIPSKEYKQITEEIQYFLKPETKESFDKYGFIYKRSCFLYGKPGTGKCLGKGTPVLMFDGSIKLVEDVIVGDLLMGDDSGPRTVKSTTTGQEQMYKVIPTKGDPYVVNESHILSLKKHEAGKEIFKDIEVRDWLKWNKTNQSRFKGYRVGAEFDKVDVPIDPYFLGIWIGDGNNRSQTITSMDKEIVSYLTSYASSLDMSVTTLTQEGKCPQYDIVGSKGKPNHILTSLREMELLHNKHIPQIYKSNDRESRLNLLAGLIDSDGHLDRGGYEITTKYESLRDDILYLARSLGFAAYSSVKEVKLGGWDEAREYQRIFISGDMSVVPCKLSRKKAEPRKQIKDVLVTGIKLEKLEVGDYYGFEIDGNRRFLLGDFTVTHNTCIINRIAKDVVDSGGIVLFDPLPPFLESFYQILNDTNPDTTVLVIFEEMDKHFGDHDNYESELLSILDGEIQKSNVIYLATTNFIEKVPARILRPGRFSSVIEVEFPDEVCREFYLQNKLGDEDISMLIKRTAGFSIDEIKEVVLATKCLGQSIGTIVDKINKLKES